MSDDLVDGVNPSISDEDQRTVRMIMKIFHKHKKARSHYDRNWMHYYRLFRGDQWDGVKMPRFRQKEVVNMIWQAIQNSQSQQVDVRPRISYVPREPNDMPFAKTLNDIVNADWERHNWLVDMTEMILDGYIYGTGYGQVGYDPDIDYGMGSATFSSEDPFYLYPTPESKEINGPRSVAFIKAEPVDTSWLKSEHPDHADNIKADITDVISSSKASINDFTFKSTNTDLDMPDLTILRGSEKSDNKTLLITAYLKPSDTEEVEQMVETDDGTEQTKSVIKKVYPYGRVVKIASGIVLEDTDHLPFSNGLFPFVKYVNYILPREFYGVSEVEQLESPQRTFNKLLNASLEILNLMGNPVWVVDTASGVNPRTLTNRTGAVIEKEPGSEVDRLAGQNLNPSALQLIDRMEVWFNNVAGTQEVSQGDTPGSVSAASAIEALQEAARTRVKQKQRNLDATIRDWGQQYADIVLEKYSKPRVFRVTGDDGSTKFFRFNTEKVDVDGKQVTKAVIREFNQKDDGTLVADNEVKEMLISSRFDVQVSTTSSLPFAKSKQEERALNLFDRGIIDEQEVLTTLEYPNKDAVLSRLEQRKAEAAQAEATKGA